MRAGTLFILHYIRKRRRVRTPMYACSVRSRAHCCACNLVTQTRRRKRRRRRRRRKRNGTITIAESGGRRVAALRSHRPFLGAETEGKRNPADCPPIRRSETVIKTKERETLYARYPLHTMPLSLFLLRVSFYCYKKKKKRTRKVSRYSGKISTRMARIP